MLFYNISIRGTSHEKMDKPNQDFSLCIKEKNLVFAGIADGVGSSRHSEIASKEAIITSVNYCKDNIKEEDFDDEEKILNIIKEAYSKAQSNIENIALENNNSFNDYDTTLSLVIYNGTKVYYGHSGDGGIILLNKKGDYIKLTKPQKGDNGVSVIPLRFGESSWEFGIYKDEEVASVLLATDGVYDLFFPYLLKDEEVSIYISFARYFMDNHILELNEDNIEDIKNEKQEFLNSEICREVYDDKTILVIVNPDIVSDIKDDDYYKEPNWDELLEKWNKKAYPHLYE